MGDPYEELKEAKAENERLRKLIKEFVWATPILVQGRSSIWIDAVSAFECHVEQLKADAECRKEEARIRAHVENILREKGLTNPPPGNRTIFEYKENATGVTHTSS